MTTSIPNSRLRKGLSCIHQQIVSEQARTQESQKTTESVLDVETILRSRKERKKGEGGDLDHGGLAEVMKNENKRNRETGQTASLLPTSRYKQTMFVNEAAQSKVCPFCATFPL